MKKNNLKTEGDIYRSNRASSKKNASRGLVPLPTQGAGGVKLSKQGVTIEFTQLQKGTGQAQESKHTQCYYRQRALSGAEGLSRHITVG